MTRWGPYVERRLTEIRGGEGRELWDGRWPSPETADWARDVAARALPDNAATPSVVPTEDGAVALIWRKGGWDVELEVRYGCYSSLWASHGESGRMLSGNLGDLLQQFGELMAELAD